MSSYTSDSLAVLRQAREAGIQVFSEFTREFTLENGGRLRMFGSCCKSIPIRGTRVVFVRSVSQTLPFFECIAVDQSYRGILGRDAPTGQKELRKFFSSAYDADSFIDTPEGLFVDRAFKYRPGAHKFKIQPGTDVVITSGPPHSILDIDPAKSQEEGSFNPGHAGCKFVHSHTCIAVPSHADHPSPPLLRWVGLRRWHRPRQVVIQW